MTKGVYKALGLLPGVEANEYGLAVGGE